jgi:hypothetical protein
VPNVLSWFGYVWFRGFILESVTQDSVYCRIVKFLVDVCLKDGVPVQYRNCIDNAADMQVTATTRVSMTGRQPCSVIRMDTG